MVRSDRQEQGLGRTLLGVLLDHAAARGCARSGASCPARTTACLALATASGFAPEGGGDPATIRIGKILSRHRAPADPPQPEPRQPTRA